MVWARFDDRYSENPKVLEAGPWAELLDMRAIIYCCRNETDGLVTRSALQRISHGIPSVGKKADVLVAVGRWSVNEGGGWLIHNFLTYNPSKAALTEQRTKNKERQRKHRNGVTNTVTNAYPRSGRESLVEPEETKTRAPWLVRGETREEWMAKGCPAAPPELARERFEEAP